MSRDVSRGRSLFMRPLHSWTAVRLWPRHQKGVKEEPQEQGGDHASPITHVRAAVREPNQSANRGEVMVVPRTGVQCRLKTPVANKMTNGFAHLVFFAVKIRLPLTFIKKDAKNLGTRGAIYLRITKI